MIGSLESVVLAFVLLALAVLVAVAHDLLIREVEGWLPHLHRLLVRLAARRLPGACSERYREEWLAELSSLEDRPLTALVYALGTFEVSWRARRQFRGPRPAVSTQPGSPSPNPGEANPPFEKLELHRVADLPDLELVVVDEAHRFENLILVDAKTHRLLDDRHESYGPSD